MRSPAWRVLKRGTVFQRGGCRSILITSALKYLLLDQYLNRPHRFLHSLMLEIDSTLGKRSILKVAEPEASLAPGGLYFCDEQSVRGEQALSQVNSFTFRTV